MQSLNYHIQTLNKLKNRLSITGKPISKYSMRRTYLINLSHWIGSSNRMLRMVEVNAWQLRNQSNWNSWRQMWGMPISILELQILTTLLPVLKLSKITKSPKMRFWIMAKIEDNRLRPCVGLILEWLMKRPFKLVPQLTKMLCLIPLLILTLAKVVPNYWLDSKNQQ